LEQDGRKISDKANAIARGSLFILKRLGNYALKGKPNYSGKIESDYAYNRIAPPIK
tara:strand:+ start:898 stop:1065 length:168 start_codon:yes stop_codon:yes gene_type:complete